MEVWLIKEAMVWVLFLTSSELRKETEVVGCSFKAVCYEKGVEALSEMILEEAWVFVQQCGKVLPVYVGRINKD